MDTATRSKPEDIPANWISDTERRIKQAIGDRVLTLRKMRKKAGQSGWTQKAVAERAGISLRQFQKIEKGQALPQLRIILRVAKAMDISPLELFQ